MPQHHTSVWSVAIDCDAPLSSSVHASEAGAWLEVSDHFTITDEERKMAAEFIGSCDTDGLRNYVSKLIGQYASVDSYSVDKHEITVQVPWPSDADVSEDEREYGVTVTADVKADSPREALGEFVKSLQIGNSDGLTFLVSNLKTGAYEEFDS